MLFATDPVVLDKTMALCRPDRDNHYLQLPGGAHRDRRALGWGEFDDAKIQLQRIELG
jgi:hypothetical protein